MGNVASSGFEKSLLKSIPKKLVALPSKDDYQFADVKPYNHEIKTAPVAVTYPTNPEQVQAIIKCANKWNMKVQARSGGHSYGNYGK
jgi:FAD/FMN-containing dehydrogenase